MLRLRIQFAITPFGSPLFFWRAISVIHTKSSPSSVLHVEVKQHVQFVVVVALQDIMETLIIVLLAVIQEDVNGVMVEDIEESGNILILT